MSRACADALGNAETHVAALQKEIEGLRAQSKKLQAIATELQSKSQWVSVTERMPEDEKPVLAYYGYHVDGGIDVGMMFVGKLTYFCSEPNPYWTSRNLFVTHWMPLPEPPKEDCLDAD